MFVRHWSRVNARTGENEYCYPGDEDDEDDGADDSSVEVKYHVRTPSTGIASQVSCSSTPQFECRQLVDGENRCKQPMPLCSCSGSAQTVEPHIQSIFHKAIATKVKEYVSFAPVPVRERSGAFTPARLQGPPRTDLPMSWHTNVSTEIPKVHVAMPGMMTHLTARGISRACTPTPFRACTPTLFRAASPSSVSPWHNAPRSRSANVRPAAHAVWMPCYPVLLGNTFPVHS